MLQLILEMLTPGSNKTRSLPKYLRNPVDSLRYNGSQDVFPVNIWQHADVLRQTVTDK